MIQFAITQCLRLSTHWQEVGVCVASLDVEKAFDRMQQSAITQLLLARGWSMHGVGVVLAHMQGMIASPELEGAKPVPDFSYALGGRQGGSETATIFADMLEAMLSPVVHMWQILGHGFRVDNKVICTHFIWADNVYITAADETDLTEMVRMASAVLAQWGFRWKPSSLECMTIDKRSAGRTTPERKAEMRWAAVVPDIFHEPAKLPALPEQQRLDKRLAGAVTPEEWPGQCTIVTQENQQDHDGASNVDALAIVEKSEIKVLGSWVHHNCKATFSLEHNQRKCERKCWTMPWLHHISKCHRHLVRQHRARMVQAYLKHFQPILLWGCEAWRLDDTFLDMIARWECAFILKLLGGVRGSTPELRRSRRKRMLAIVADDLLQQSKKGRPGKGARQTIIARQ